MSYEVNRKGLGQTLKYLRTKRGMTQADLYEGICTRNHYSAIENGHSDVTLSKFIEFSNRLSIDIDEFLFISNDSKMNDKDNLSKFFMDAYLTDNKQLMLEVERKSLEKYNQSESFYYKQLHVMIRVYTDKVTQEEIKEMTNYFLKQKTYISTDINMFQNFIHSFKKKDVFKIADKILTSFLTYSHFKEKEIGFWGIFLNVIDYSLDNNELLIAEKYINFITPYIENSRDAQAKIFLTLHTSRFKMISTEDSFKEGYELAMKVIATLDLLKETIILNNFKSVINEILKERGHECV